MAQDRPLNGAGHQPDRGTYDCVACEKPWPCHPAREHLRGSVPNVAQLSMRLWTELEHAAGPLREEPPAALFDRFLKWARLDS